MSRLVFVGVATDDSIAVVPHLPRPDERLVSEALVRAGGGTAATAAVAAARLSRASASGTSTEVGFVGPVADDGDGERILEGLRSEGVDVSGVVRVAAGSGGASVILVDRATGTRSICTRPVSAFSLAGGPAVERARGSVAAADWVHVDHLGWPAVSALEVRRLSVDAGNPIPGFHPKGVDLYVPTVAALRRTYGDLPPASLVERAIADGASRVVATNGARGAVAADAAGLRVTAPGFEIPVVSTLGAGDVFHGALLLAVSRGTDLAEAVRYANAAAALSCRAYDGRSAIPTDAELTGWLADRPE